MAERGLPVDPSRLRRQFPALTDADIAVYEEVTARILAEGRPEARARLARDLVALGRKARDRATGGVPLSDEESLAVRYLVAVEKMQGRTAR